MEEISQYILTTKIALATAIIRSKPGELTGAQYCASLCSAYTQRTTKQLIEKNNQLKEQVLFYRQKLHLEQSVVSHGAEQPASEETENEVFLTPPSSSEEPTAARLEQLKQRFSQHALFLNHLKPICQLSDNSNSHVSLEIIKETIDGTIKSIKEALKEKNISAHVQNAMKKAVKALGVVCNDRDVFHLVRPDIEELVSTLIDMIMSDKDLNNMDAEYSKSHLLVTLGTCSSLKFKILDVTLQIVTRAANTLRKSANQSFDPVMHDNLYYLLWSMEEILQTECIVSPSERVLSSDEHREIQDHLEQSIIHFDSYPLINMYLMKLTHMLEFLLQTEK